MGEGAFVIEVLGDGVCVVVATGVSVFVAVVVTCTVGSGWTAVVLGVVEVAAIASVVEAGGGAE